MNLGAIHSDTEFITIPKSRYLALEAIAMQMCATVCMYLEPDQSAELKATLVDNGAQIEQRPNETEDEREIRQSAEGEVRNAIAGLLLGVEASEQQARHSHNLPQVDSVIEALLFPLEGNGSATESLH